MQIAHEKLDGLDRDKVLAALQPVLMAHEVDAVELVWRRDGKGWLLYLTVEVASATEPDAGISLDLCAEISRDLSTALDVSGCIDARYRLEVGSPGVERALYGPSDYQRFAGRSVQLRLEAPIGGAGSISGKLLGLDADGRVVVEDRRGRHLIDHEQIRSGRLVFEWKRGDGRRSPQREQRVRERAASTSNR